MTVLVFEIISFNREVWVENGVGEGNRGLCPIWSCPCFRIVEVNQFPCKLFENTLRIQWYREIYSCFYTYHRLEIVLTLHFP